MLRKNQMLGVRRPKRTVDRVRDGDSFSLLYSVMGSREVRINGVDTPERGEPGYYAAKRYLKNLIENKAVTLKPKAKDIYGRLIADVFIKGSNVRKKLKSRGW